MSTVTLITIRSTMFCNAGVWMCMCVCACVCAFMCVSVDGKGIMFMEAVSNVIYNK